MADGCRVDEEDKVKQDGVPRDDPPLDLSQCDHIQMSVSQ